MPKAVDIYVLQKKIGSGQFGDVFKGYSRIDGIDVAIKTINRDKVKGKFTQLLENEIQVLKSCKNNNIIQLLDIKKTVNNIYLVLQFCNEGDLGAYLKQKKKFSEEQAVQYLVQILHAFQTLVKSKIMHRDFKLPNVLKSDGVIKIADFGFSKLLTTEDQQAQTILGSPLNMAPELLNHEPYNSKADIWSIGVVFFQMVCGQQTIFSFRVPYSSSNIVELLKKIQKNPLVFPQKVSPVIEDVIRKMLVIDPIKRIEWKDLFNHPITRFRQEKLEKGLKESMVCQRNDLGFNMSRFYIKTNMVVDNTKDILGKAEFNDYLKEIMNNGERQQYKGTVIKRETERICKTRNTQINLNTQKQIENEDEVVQAEFNKKAQREKLHKRNSAHLLHDRNSYAFLGHTAQELIELNKNIYAECLAFLLVKRVIERINRLQAQISNKSHPRIKSWESFQTTAQFLSIKKFISSEKEIFNRFYEKLSLKVLANGTLAQFQENLMMSGKFTLQETNRRIYKQVLAQYLKRIQEGGQKVTTRQWTHIAKVLDSLDIDLLFIEGFDFQNYYSSYSQNCNSNIEDMCRKKYVCFLKTKKSS